MRAADVKQGNVFSYVWLEARVPSAILCAFFA